MRILSTFIILILPLFGFSQASTWLNAYGGAGNETSRWLCETPDSGLAILGTSSTYSNGLNDVWLVRVDRFGDTLWTHHYGGSELESVGSVELTADSGFIIAGGTKSYGWGTPSSSNWWLIRTNSIGDTLWTHTYGSYGNDQLYYALPLSDGGFLLTGWTDVGGYAKGTIMKVDSVGNHLWTSYMLSSANSYIYHAIEKPGNNYIVAGSAMGPGNFDVRIEEYNSSGTRTKLKNHHSGSTYADAAYSICPAHGGGFMVLGGYGYISSVNPWILCLDDNLDTLWYKLLPGTISLSYLWSNDASIHKSPHGYIICGRGYNSGNDDIKILGTDTSGNILSTRFYGTSALEYGYKAIPTSDGGFAACGIQQYTGLGWDFVVVKADSAGNIAPPNPPATNAGPDASICSDTSLSLASSTASNFNSLRWTTSGSGIFSDSSILHPVYYPSAADILNSPVKLSLTASASGFSPVTDSLWLTVYPVPAVSISGLDTMYCDNEAPIQALLSPPGGTTSGDWSGGNGFFSPAQAGPGMYSLAYTFMSTNGCSNTDIIGINVYAAPDAQLSASGSATACDGDSILLQALPIAAHSYSWLEQGMGLIPGASDSFLYVTNSGNYKLVLSSPQGCLDTSAGMQITIHPLPFIDLGTDTILCSDEILNLDAGPGFSSYQWLTGATSQSIQIDSTGIGAGTGLIWVRVENSFGCSNTDTLIFEFIDCTVIVCPGDSMALIIYPNPVAVLLYVETGHGIGNHRISLVSIDGKVHFSEDIVLDPISARPTEIPVAGLARGTYFLLIEGSGYRESRKVILD